MTGPAAIEARRPRRWLYALPWLVVVVLLGSALLRSTTAAGGEAGPREGGPGEHDLLLTPVVELDVRTAARTALGTHGLAPGGGAASADAWVLDLVLDRPSLTPAGAEVVVHATVITRTEDRWTGPTSAAVVVPLSVGPPSAVAGPAVPLDPTATTDTTGAPAPAEEHP
jgi:hypothetical protein